MKSNSTKRNLMGSGFLGLVYALFFFGGSGEILAQGSGDSASATVVDSSSTSSSSSSVAAVDEGVLYNVPLVPSSLQQDAPGGSAAAGTATLHGNFIQRLGQFYWADWRGKLPSSPAPKRRMLDAPLDSSPFPSSDWAMVDRPRSVFRTAGSIR